MTIRMTIDVIVIDWWWWWWPQKSLKIWWRFNDGLAVTINDAAPWSILTTIILQITKILECDFLRQTGIDFTKRNILTKLRQIGIPTRDSFSRRILKACNIGWVEALYLKPKIVFSRSTNASPVRNRLNTIVHTRILIRVMTIFPQNVSILVFASKFF